MAGFRSVFKQVSLYGLAGFGVLCLIVLLSSPWYIGPLKHQIRSILEAECSSENIDEIEGVDTLNEIKRVVDRNRNSIREDMIGYQYPNGKYNISASKLEDLVIEENGRPIRSIILTSWRSGSTFLGEAIASHPGNFYHFEPLSDFRVIKVRGPPLAANVLDRIRALLHCDYAGSQDELINYAKNRRFIFENISYLWEQCVANSSICFDHRYLSAMCKLFPFQSMKLTRIRLHLAEELLADDELAVRLVLLVRDPRATMRSRKSIVFCSKGPDCSETALHCADLISDYKIAVELRKKYPNTFRVIRYEDLSTDLSKKVEELSIFFGRDFHPQVKSFLDTHSTKETADPFDTFRNTTATVFRWKTDMKFEDVEEIQRICAVAMEYWGYVPAINATHLREFHPVTDYYL